MKKMLVIDGNSILNRAFYGIRLLTNKNGLYTNAIYGMITMISKHMENLNPDYCAIAFDLKAPTFRHKMYDGYKANRKGMPDELAVQLPYAKECMDAMGLHVISKEGYEADDLLGTLSNIAAKENVHAYVLTGDRDSLQLIQENISVLLAKTKETVVFDRKVFFENYNVYPEQFIDVKALMGDSSDNIPGVAGIGEKTALKLISEFGSLDNMYSKIDSSSLSTSVKQKLISGKEMAYLSQKLATIDKYVPIDNTLDSFSYTGYDASKLYKLFTELEFSALIKKLELDNVNTIKMTLQDNENTVRSTKITFDLFIENCKEKNIALFHENDLISLASGNVYCEFDDKNTSFIDTIAKNFNILCFDYKNIVKYFNKIGTDVPKCDFDCMLAAYVLNSNRSSYSFDEVCLRYVEQTISENDNKAYILLKLSEKLRDLIEKEDQTKLLYDIEIPLASVLAEMEENGFKIDVEGIKKYGEELASCLSLLEERIYGYALCEFNINSPKQLGEILFESLKLPIIKKTKTGYSTDADVLQKLIPYHPIIQDILDYRQIAKLKSTYADALAKAADGEGRIHSIFNQTGTATGRLSSSEPNLQNIPVRTELGRNFRKFFIPKNENYVLIDADYSQIELRLLAHIANDETMKNAFTSGDDIHTATAAKVFDVAPENVTIELRKKAKAVNFGILYGIGEYSLSEDIGISKAQAKKYIESYLAGFPEVSAYLDNIKITAKDNGYVTTLFGRKRYIPELSSSNKNIQHFGERVAMNSPIQGTAADIIKIAMINVNKELKNHNYDARLILQVHDELLIESNINCSDEVMELLITCMENAVKLSVPLNVEAKKGATWFETK